MDATKPLNRREHGVFYQFALEALADLRKREEAYQEDCEDDRRNGHRPHYCRHGMDLWVDWDPICGYCEDPKSIHEEALIIAHEQYNHLRKVLDLVLAAHRLRPPPEVADPMMTWLVQVGPKKHHTA